MPLPVTVHLLRHGEVHNPDGILYGRLPGFRLSALGERQAVAAAVWLADRDIGHLVASPLERARQTAAPLAAATGLDVHLDERLIEADNHFEGRQISGGKSLFADPKNWRWFVNPLRPSWGEPYEQVADRVLAAARAAAARTPTGAAVCVSHQLPIVAACLKAQGLRLAHDPRKRQCALASVSSLTFDGDVVVGYDYHEPAAALPAGHGAGA